MAKGSLREELEEAAAGLQYHSESDYPFQFFTLPAESEKDLTPEGFLNRIGVSQQFREEMNLEIDQLIEERTLDGFFPASDDAEAKRFQELEVVLRKRLRGVKVLRVGRVEIRCYIAGLDEHGYIAGLVTISVET